MDATQKNILAIKDHSQATRKIVRDLKISLNEKDVKIKHLESSISILQQQMQVLQVKIFSGGATE